MRNKHQILKEIVELSGIKSAYNHYLASSRSLTEVENTTQIRRNRDVVSANLNDLYGELRILPTAKSDETRNSVTVRHSPAEQQAITNFNRDRRFTITE